MSSQISQRAVLNFINEMNYSKEELVHMVYALGKANGNCLLASRIYKANYPDLQRYPRTDCFENVKERFERTANANYEKNTRLHESTNEDRQFTIVASVIENPNTSVRQISDETGIPKSTINKVLKKNKFHPYHTEYHQSLLNQDFRKRVQFCDWALTRMREDPAFFSKVLFTDESSFSSTCRANQHNFHHYAQQNPRLFREVDYQHRFKVNVWAGICGEHVVGPHFFDGNLTADMYLQFLQQELHLLQIGKVPPNILVRQWFQHDGAPPHYSLAVI